MCWPCSSLSLIKSQCFVNEQFLCMCATYTISWQVGWCCVLKSCVDHAQVCHWSSHSALLTNSFFACVRPTPLAGRLADAAYFNHMCWPCSSLSLIKSQCFVNGQFFNMCATYTISWQVGWCCVLKLCVDHAQVCHWSRHSALFQLILNICATYTIVGWQVGWCCMLHTQIMRCPRSRLSLITSQCFISTVS